MQEAIEVTGQTRAAFILRGALAAATFSGAGAVGPFVQSALAQQQADSQDGTANDSDILRIALTLELLESAFYTRALMLPLRSEVRSVAQVIVGHERAHAQRLKAEVFQSGSGTEEETGETFHFPMKTERDFLKLAVTLEEGGVSAYNGAAPLIRSRFTLALAGSIVQIEGRHAAAVRMLAGDPPAPEAFDKPVSLGEATVAAAQYINQF